MRPINVVIVVVTVIESLRAFDIVYIINKGKNGLELLSTLITNNSISEANLLGFGSAIAVVLLVISLVPIITFLNRQFRQDAAMTAATAPVTAEAAVHTRPSRIRWQRVVLHLFLILTSLIWLFPILWTLLQALRPYGDVIKDGYVALAAHLSLQNFATAWEQGDLGHFFRNTLIIAIPAVIGTLFISSMLGVRRSRGSASRRTSCC